MKALKIKLIKYYFLFSLGLGVLVVIVHGLFSLFEIDLLSSPVDSVFIWIMCIISSYFYYNKFLTVVAMNKNNRLMIPVMFVFGSSVACFGMVNVVNHFRQIVVAVDSVDDLSTANGNYFKISRIEPKVEGLLDKMDERYETKPRMFDQQYRALVPLASQHHPNRFNVWIELNHLDKHPRGTDEEIKKLKEAGLPKGRQWVKDFRYDSVGYFERSGNKSYDLLKENDYPITAETVILKPGSGSFLAFQISEVLMYLGIYLLPSLLLAGLVWSVDGGSHRTGQLTPRHQDTV